MEITSDFKMRLPPDAAYAVLLDLERVTPCMPGAELGPPRPDGSREVTVRVKIGPMRFTYGGAVQVVEQDPAQRSAVLVGTATEARGQGDAKATIRMQVSENGDGSHVTAHAEFELAGRAGQMGHGPVQAVSKQLIGQMTQCLDARFGPEAAAPAQDAASAAPDAAASTPAAAAAPPEPLRGGRLLLAVLRERLRALFRRGRTEG